MSGNKKYYWRCITEGCKVTATTVGRTLVAFKGEHFHSDDQEKIIHSQIRDIIKGCLIREPYRPAQEIYDCAKEELVNFYATNVDIAHLIPAFDSVKSNIYRWRSALVPSVIVIIDRNVQFDPKKIQIDFEQATFNGLSSVFPKPKSAVVFFIRTGNLETGTKARVDKDVS
ncbi:hypothetical protein GJ496_003805 [Pomphorhynchus laevis]|nr:hypothetical protein GJ496_003805 [Pomphorhynchus laevis]